MQAVRNKHQAQEAERPELMKTTSPGRIFHVRISDLSSIRKAAKAASASHLVIRPLLGQLRPSLIKFERVYPSGFVVNNPHGHTLALPLPATSTSVQLGDLALEVRGEVPGLGLEADCLGWGIKSKQWRWS